MPEEPNDNRSIAGIIYTIRGSSAGGPTEKIKEALPKRRHTAEIISFSNEDIKGVEIPHDDAVVISLAINKFDVKRILVDNGSSADILFYDTFQRMGLTIDRLWRVNAPLIGFSGDSVPTEGVIKQ